MQRSRPVIGLISAVQAAIPPAQAAIRELLPSATLWNVLDDRLLDDAEGAITEALAARMRRLIDHTVLEGADAVLLTCSMYASVARDAAAEVDVPLFGPDEALFSAAAHGGYRRLALVSPALDPLADSLARIRPVVGTDVAVEAVVAEGAAAAARGGDVSALADAIIRAVSPVAGKIDAVVLGQYSLAPAAAGVQTALRLPTLAGPRYAAHALRVVLDGDAA
ncbi:hypothetical protein AFM11_33635 [Mycolicibacterium wolinskyi]|uniref:Asp/Glu racemase n=2 Tax=Mycolicibacterium wolinskyi TaxID=59750 RepID=A0A132PBZ9_9MYCO|nr:hypothetical protein AFM11_33635 [Mycolicibacterium wolinskyi]